MWGRVLGETQLAVQVEKRVRGGDGDWFEPEKRALSATGRNQSWSDVNWEKLVESINLGNFDNLKLAHIRQRLTACITYVACTTGR